MAEKPIYCPDCTCQRCSCKKKITESQTNTGISKPLSGFMLAALAIGDIGGSFAFASSGASKWHDNIDMRAYSMGKDPFKKRKRKR